MTVHQPVMLREVLHHLAPQAGDRIVDGTFGGGGYTRAILQAAPCTVLGLDKDAGAIERGRDLQASSNGRLQLTHSNFKDVASAIQPLGWSRINGMVLDLGLSSDQLDSPQRGFSFRFDAPLDMRLDTSQGISAAQLLAQTDERELARIIFTYGEETRARQIARRIVETRYKNPITTTGALAALVRGVIGSARGAIDPATKTFQALRIAVNDELGSLEQGLAALPSLLSHGARLVVVAFHSLEDRLVKNFFRSHLAPKKTAPTLPCFSTITKKPLSATSEEVRHNPRARSAKLRAGVWLLPEAG